MFIQGLAAICFLTISVVDGQLDCEWKLNSCSTQASAAAQIEEGDGDSVNQLTKEQFCLLRDTFTTCYRKLVGRCDFGEFLERINGTFKFLDERNGNYKCEDLDAPALSCTQTFEVCQRRAAEIVKNMDPKNIVNAPKDVEHCLYFQELSSCYTVHLAQGGGCQGIFNAYFLTEHGLGLETKCGDYFRECSSKEDFCSENAADAVKGLDKNTFTPAMVSNLTKEQFCNYTHTLSFCGRDISRQCPSSANGISAFVNYYGAYPRCNADACGLQQRKCLEITSQNIFNLESTRLFWFSKAKICGFERRVVDCSKGLNGQCASIFKPGLEIMKTCSSIAGCHQ